MKQLILVITLVILSGCSVNKPYIIKEASTYGSIGSESTITIIDKRPSDDKAFSFGSMMVFKSNYGVWTLGDEQFSPNLINLLKMKLHKDFSNNAVQPKLVALTLERMIIQSNHQADLLQSTSTSGGIGPLGVLIAESMHGKKFELDYDKTRPFVIGLIKAQVKLSYSSGKVVEENIMVSKVENFSNHMDAEGREKAALSVASSLVDSFSTSLQTKN